MNIYHKLWLEFTVWMLRHDKFDYSYLSDRELRERIHTYKQGWPWVEANVKYALEILK